VSVFGSQLPSAACAGVLIPFPPLPPTRDLPTATTGAALPQTPSFMTGVLGAATPVRKCMRLCSLSLSHTHTHTYTHTHTLAVLRLTALQHIIEM
jgi:hypothetical protein